MAIEETMREFINEELAGMYTISLVIVESVDHENRRAEVSFKYEQDVIIDNVPIASPFVGNEFGSVWPVYDGTKADPTEGFVLHNRRPITPGVENAGPVENESDRRFQVEDAILFPLMWNDEMTVPDHEPGELLMVHPAVDKNDEKTIFRIKPDSTTILEHPAPDNAPATPKVQIDPDGTTRFETAIGEQGFLFDPNDGSFKLLDEGGYGIVSDGQGNFTWYAKDVNTTNNTTSL